MKSVFFLQVGCTFLQAYSSELVSLRIMRRFETETLPELKKKFENMKFWENFPPPSQAHNRSPPLSEYGQVDRCTKSLGPNIQRKIRAAELCKGCRLFHPGCEFTLSTDQLIKFLSFQLFNLFFVAIVPPQSSVSENDCHCKGFLHSQLKWFESFRVWWWLYLESPHFKPVNPHGANLVGLTRFRNSFNCFQFVLRFPKSPSPRCHSIIGHQQKCIMSGVFARSTK